MTSTNHVDTASAWAGGLDVDLSAFLADLHRRYINPVARRRASAGERACLHVHSRVAVRGPSPKGRHRSRADANNVTGVPTARLAPAELLGENTRDQASDGLVDLRSAEPPVILRTRRDRTHLPS